MQKYCYNRLKDLKEDNEKNQGDLAKIINMSEKQYGRYERGETDLPLEKAIMLAKYYKVSLDYIAGLTNDKGGLHKNSADEQKIIDAYNNLSEKGKGKLELFAEQLTKKELKEKL